MNVTSEGKRVANRGIFALVEMAVAVGPYDGIGSQVHKV